MNLRLKAVFICTASNNRWGKGYTLAEAKKNAGVHQFGKTKTIQYYVYAAVYDNPDEDELALLFDALGANQIDGSPTYVNDNPGSVIEKHIGWLLIEKNY